MEGAVLDFWKLDKSRLPSCAVMCGEPRGGALPALRPARARLNAGLSGSGTCRKWSQDKISPLARQGRVAHRDSVCAGALSDMHATVADVFQPAQPAIECGPIFVASHGDMIPFQAGVFALAGAEGESLRHRKGRTASEMTRQSPARWKYAQQAGPAGLGAVTHARTTVEVVCHAEL